MSEEAGLAFFEQFIRPTLELGKRLQDENKILAGDPLAVPSALL